MKRQAFITIAVIFTMATVVGISFAGNGGRRGHAMDLDAYYQACSQDWAKLTDDQKSKLKALNQKFIDETATARASIISKHEEIRILMETTSPDQAKLHALSAELTELKKQVMDKNIDMALDAKKIAPELDASMLMGGHGRMGREGMGMMGKCSMMGNGMGMMDGMGKKGMIRKMNCPAMATQSQDKMAQPQNDETATDKSKSN